MRNKILRQLIMESRGSPEVEKYEMFRLIDPQPLAVTAKELMSIIPPAFGACAMLSASWAGVLQDQYSIPAIVVAGDLRINEHTVFDCKKNLPDFDSPGKLVADNWDGHCWIEIDGYIGDLSIFRTAYAIERSSLLKDYITTNFGHGRGAMLSPYEQVPEGMQYIPKFVLNDNQINGLIAGMGYQLEKGI